MSKNRIYLCLAHMSEAGLEQKYIKEVRRIKIRKEELVFILALIESPLLVAFFSSLSYFFVSYSRKEIPSPYVSSV